ncbi:sce7726 family protein [Rhodococcus sp. KRD162]|uniref:sce7726 family protein n=1 Tax=Rhodococcus sp. KRD162 TaxID=2729725 RepID=UPI0019CFB25B|nr:sce7726 family protein [Rhodococcus sp. KRD162]
MNRDKNELSALTRIFSATVFREFGRRARSPLFSRLIEQSSIATRAAPKATVGNVFDQAFDVLKECGVRDEYIYRSAITQKIVLGRHSLNTATILSEARAGQCKADVVVLNGTSTAYEIKSERDSLNRLRNQLNNYRQVFAAVNVVVSPVHLKEVLSSTPADIGVLVLSRRFTLQTEREAQNRPDQTSPLMILETLRASEAVSVLRSLGIEAPAVPNTQLRGELRRLFVDLDPTLLHRQMVTTLKQSRSQSTMSEFVRSVPKSLRAAALSTNVTDADRPRIKEAVDTPLDVALAWK